MHPRFSVCVGLAALLTGGVVTITTGQAAARATASPTHRAVVKTAAAVLPHYKIRVIGVNNDDSSTQAIVSANGRYLVNNYTDAIEYDTKTGERIGEVEANNPFVTGVANDGTLVGIAVIGGADTAFSWHDGTYYYFPAPSNLGCASPTGVGSTFDGVTPQGIAVGSEFYSCDGDPAVGVAISHPDTSGGFSTIGQSGPTPAIDAFVDSGDLAVGYAGAGDGGSQVTWNPETNSAPVSVRSATGFPGLYPFPSVNFWNSSGEFIATGADTTNAVELINGKKFTDIPSTAANGFVANALGNNGIVVGGDNEVTAKVWSPSLGIRTLKSLAGPTSESLLRALAVDANNNIYGVGQDSHDTIDYWEAELIHPAPTVKITKPKSAHTYKKGAKLKASYSCKAGSGTTLKSCKGSVKDHHKISTSKAGKHSFKVVATDADGRKTTKTVHFKIKNT